jgi:hypothetical protein
MRTSDSSPGLRQIEAATMHRRTALVALSLLPGLTWSRQAGRETPPAPQRKPHLRIFRDYVSPEGGVKTLWEQSEVVLLVDVTGATPEVEFGEPPRPVRQKLVTVQTLLDAEIVEVLKSRDDLERSPTGKVRIVQPNAGVVETADAVYEGTDPSLSAGNRCALFLKRRGANLEIIWGPFGTLMIVAGKISGIPEVGLNGKTLEEFREILRTF